MITVTNSSISFFIFDREYDGGGDDDDDEEEEDVMRLR